MTAPPPGPRSRGRDILGLLAFAAACAAVSIIGGAVTRGSIDTWYRALDKPAFNPPDWVFPIVWTALYVMMAIAAWRVWRRAPIRTTWPALSAFAVQLTLNLAWSFLFFGLQRIELALAEIVVLLLAIAVSARLFWRIDRWAGALMAPYFLWVCYATALNAALFLIN
ncbi:MAG: tryptophan-rich sensory protein [Rhodospirillales bacterium]|nr:MAG: tryptophan-rich sensory protein [Rhodospirillales bacterium]